MTFVFSFYPLDFFVKKVYNYIYKLTAGASAGRAWI